MDTSDIVIETILEEDQSLREANRQLVDLVADLAFENAQLRILHQHEFVSRMWGDKQIERLQRQRHQRHDA